MSVLAFHCPKRTTCEQFHFSVAYLLGKPLKDIIERTNNASYIAFVTVLSWLFSVTSFA